ncbi:MAG: glycosyltransferase [Chloroflexi bacterium]|nr:glycosyltransferase [Chloroflexota bacterium]MCY3936971.1 glycosyltransferase [Chloroflexota bacterium]
MTDQRVSKRLSVVIPAFAQEGSIGPDLERIQKTIRSISRDYQIVVVVDGVVDRTAEIARAVAGPRTSVEVIEKNRGKGFAVRRGVSMTDGRVVGFIDAGGDIDPSAIQTTASLIGDGTADIAIGSKRHPLSEVKYPLGRRISSRGYQWLCRLLFGLSVRDTQVGIKFMSRAVADSVMPSLETDGFSFDVEMLALAHRRGFVRLRECPVKIDLAFPSTINSGTVVRMLLDTLRIFFRMRVMRRYDD